MVEVRGGHDDVRAQLFNVAVVRLDTHPRRTVADGGDARDQRPQAELGALAHSSAVQRCDDGGESSPGVKHSLHEVCMAH